MEGEELVSSPTSSSSSLEFEDPEDMFYRDHRASQRSTYLVAHTDTREAKVRDEMMVALGEFGKLLVSWGKETGLGNEYGIDLHDLSRENVFVDENDHTKVVSIVVFVTMMLLISCRLALSIGNLSRRGRFGIHTIYRVSCTTITTTTITLNRAQELVHTIILQVLVLLLFHHCHPSIELLSSQ